MESLASNVWKRVVIRGRKRKRRRNLVDITILTWDEIYNTIDNFISLVVHKNRDEKIRGKHFSFLGWTKEEEKKRIIRSPIEIRAKRGRGKLGISAFVSRPCEDRAAWRANDVSNGDIYVAILRPDQSVDRCTTLRIDAMGNERRRRFFNLSVEKQSIRIAIPFFWLMAAFENGFEIRPFVADPSISMTSLTITICTAYQFRSEARKYAAIFRQGKINDSSPSLRLIFEESRNRSSWKMY